MNIIFWILFGLVAGLIANTVDPAPNKGGLLGTIILGVLGSLVGGLLGNLVLGLGITGFNFTSFFLAILGSLMLLALERGLSRRLD